MQLVNREVSKYDMISIPAQAGSTQSTFAFPDQPQLRGVKVYGIDLVYNNTDLYNQTNANYTGTLIENGFITLYFDGKTGIQNMPLRELSHINNFGTPYVPQNTNTNGILALNGQVITWTKSFISFPQPPVFAANCVFVIGVYYSF
jgi:hypothetical protein